MEPMRYTELVERKLKSAVDYNLLFENDSYEGVRTTVLDVGVLNLPTGQIIACDPLQVLSNEEGVCNAFAYSVPPGQYPVDICVARGGASAGGDRYAASRLTFTGKRPVKWLLALRGNENLSDLSQDGDYFGYPVEDGLGCFVDASGRIPYLRFCHFLKAYEKDLYDDYFRSQFLESVEKSPSCQREDGDWFNSLIPGDEEINLVVFQAGFGDGIYPCYWGLDEQDEVCQLVADFFVLTGC